MSLRKPQESLAKRQAATSSTTSPATASQPAKPVPKNKLPVAYYDAGRGGYWTLNTRGEWVQWKEGDLKRLMRSQGLSTKYGSTADLSEVEETLLTIQQTHDIHFAGAIAGYPAGIHTICNSRVLVTQGPNAVKPEKGDWPVFGHFLATLLGDQKIYLCAWLKSAIASLRAGSPFRPGQVLVVAGPQECGKSLLQSIITDILGGRAAKPYRYMTAKTEFNADLFSAEHLMIEDDAESTDIRSRRAFGSMVKTMCVNEVHSCHGKGRQAISLAPFWRVSITLNCEPEDLMVLPPMVEGLKDKFIVLKATPADFPFNGEDIDGRKRFRQAIKEEMPAFVAWLLAWRMPKNMIDRRYGCRSWQNPEMMRSLEALSPENLLLQFIDSLRPWGDVLDVWEGTAVELQTSLCSSDKSRQVDKLLTYHAACGTYLGRLAKEKKDRVQRVKEVEGSTVWRIKKPFE